VILKIYITTLDSDITDHATSIHASISDINIEYETAILVYLRGAPITADFVVFTG
jgi:hypothetical protein